MTRCIDLFGFLLSKGVYGNNLGIIFVVSSLGEFLLDDAVLDSSSTGSCSSDSRVRRDEEVLSVAVAASEDLRELNKSGCPNKELNEW